ncbi:hypothetical protein Drorol1_Dr00018278 [Drosera rotundifolia]
MSRRFWINNFNFTLKHLHGSIIASGLGADRFLNNHLMNLYAKFEEMGIVVKVYGSIPRKNIMSSNVLVSKLVRNGDLEGARKLFDEMPERNIELWNGMIVGLVREGRFEEGLRSEYDSVLLICLELEYGRSSLCTKNSGEEQKQKLKSSNLEVRRQLRHVLLNSMQESAVDGYQTSSIDGDESRTRA